VVAKFDQRQGSSDGGAILLKAAERRLGLTSALAAGLRDDRHAGKVQHELRELITQRFMAIALGYEDANDAARLASDPIHKLLVGRDPVDGEDLASQGRKSVHPCWIGLLRIRGLDPIAETSELPDHSRGAPLF
jgi:hypothetical protein